MKDILLYSVLRRANAHPSSPDFCPLDPHTALPLLESLEQQGLETRFPFFGVLTPALDHPDEAIAASALRNLSGANGPYALARIAAALSDERPNVMRAAVSALFASSQHHPARYAHALFHADPRVRTTAHEIGLPPQCDALFSVYLLADPHCKNAVFQRLTSSNKKELSQNSIDSPITLAADHLPVLLDLLQQGEIPAATAPRLLAGIPWEQAIQALAKGRRRSDDQIDRILHCIEEPSPPPLEPAEFDEFDIIFDIMCDQALYPSATDSEQNTSRASIANPSVQGFWRQIANTAFSLKAPMHRRLCASLLHTALQKAYFCEPAAALCTALLPRFSATPWLDPALRRRSISALYDFGARLTPLKDEEVQALLDIDIAKREGGSRDLWVIGGLLHWVRNHPYKRLIRWIPKTEIIEAFALAPEYSAPILCLHDDSKRGRDYLMARIFERCPQSKTLIQALLLVISHTGELDHLNNASAGQALEIAIELLRILQRPGMRLSLKKQSAIADILGHKIARGNVYAFVSNWLTLETPALSALGLRVFGVITSIIEVDDFIELSLRLPPETLYSMLRAIEDCPAFPFGKELALCRALRKHEDPRMRAWADERIPEALGDEEEIHPKPQFDRPDTARPLEAHEYDAIVSATKATLLKALAPCLGIAHTGLSAALQENHAQGRFTEPSADICCALLGCHDDPRQIAAAFARYASDTADFTQKLEQKAVLHWLHQPNLPLFANAWLYRFERHLLAFLQDIERIFPNAAAVLHFAIELQSDAISERIWASMDHAFSVWRWRRSLEPLKQACSDALCQTLSEALEGKNGLYAAKMLLSLAESEIDTPRFDAMKPHIVERLSDFSPAVTAELSRWIQTRGVIGRSLQKKNIFSGEDADLIRQIQSLNDLGALELFCKSPKPEIVTEAVLALLSQGEAGAGRIAGLLKHIDTIECANILIDSIPLWPEGPALREARDISMGLIDTSSELRFRISLALISMGETARIEDALGAVCMETQSAWFRAQDWERLLAMGLSEHSLAQALIASPHPNAYQRAVNHFLQLDYPSDVIQSELRTFLLSGSRRLLDLRRQAALRLKESGDYLGFPILLEACAERDDEIVKHLLSGAPDEFVQAAIRALLWAGTNCIPEMTAVHWLEAKDIDEESFQNAIATLFSDAISDLVRNSIVSKLERGASRAQKLRTLAETFAWGVTTGRELTGELFSIRMIGSSALGYTRFDANHVFVTPLPILRNELHGREIVEGLILHELGHHIYHRGDEAKTVWDKAQKEGLFSLLNLIADEHLERNLRAQSQSYGNKLKRLASYAFQHSQKEVPVHELLGALGGHAFSILSNIKLKPARKEGCVRVKCGPLLSALEKAGRAFPRFVRALRMGLGNRHKDPLVTRALSLIGGDLKGLSMNGLYDIALKLRDLFGFQTRLLEHFGSAEAVGGDASDQMIFGEGITAAELEAEIERVLNPDKRKHLQSDQNDGGGRRWINVSPDEEFTTISSVVKVPFNPSEHTKYAVQVARYARLMRAYLHNLGLQFVTERRRISGRRFDPSRTKDAIFKGDPRILLARKLLPQNDLFIGVLIDCSGSMQAHDHIEKAKLFATMLAEAVRGMQGIDLSLFGFTADTLYDAGNAERCAVSGLVADGGNNDAGALWHAALCARKSQRKSRLLVMISDGLPTECSADALKSLVRRLSAKSHIACAQIAVQPLVEVCFPHYVVLNERNPDAAVRRFGMTIASLVRKTLQGG